MRQSLAAKTHPALAILTLVLLACGTPAVLQAGILPCVVPDCPTGAHEGRAAGTSDMLSGLPPTRSSMPPSLRNAGLVSSAEVNRSGALKGGDEPVCGVNGMCASFSEEQTDVIAWIGFLYSDSLDFFVATFGQEAIHLGGGQYFTPFWDKRHYWIQVSDSTVPMGMQQRYVGTDPKSGHDFFSADYVGYRQPGVDYEDYLFGMSISALILEVDSEGFLVDFFIELYDENDDYVEDVNLEIGDELGTFFFGFQQEDPTIINLLSIEDLAVVERVPDFFLEEWYPGTTFPCTFCGDLDISQEQFHFMFESVDSLERFNYTDPLPIVDLSPVVDVPLGLPTQALLIALLGGLGVLFVRRMP